MLLTRNAAAAAPIRVCREVVERGRVRAAVVNSGNANAATGEQGYRRRARDARRGRRRRSASTPQQVAVAETGVIGVPLPIDAVLDRDRRGRGRALSPTGGDDFSDGDHDHRPLAEALHADSSTA